MKTPILLKVLTLVATAAPGVPPAFAQEASKEIIAVQIRKQGYECTNPRSAERDATSTNPDDSVWKLTCKNASYRVRLVPKMAATVERLPETASQSAPPQ